MRGEDQGACIGSDDPCPLCREGWPLYFEVTHRVVGNEWRERQAGRSSVSQTNKIIWSTRLPSAPQRAMVCY